MIIIKNETNDGVVKTSLANEVITICQVYEVDMIYNIDISI